jgi:hypothetical protein
VKEELLPITADLLPITADLIAELRGQGRWEDAVKLVRAHQASLKKSWAENRKQIKRISVKTIVNVKKKMGLCVSCGKEKEKISGSLCEECKTKKRYYNKLRKQRLLIQRALVEFPDGKIWNEVKTNEYRRRNENSERNYNDEN